MPTRLASLVARAAGSSTRTRLAALALIAAAGGVASYSAPHQEAAVAPAAAQALPTVLPPTAAPVAAQTPAAPAPRRIYPYSIVPGGVADRAELAQAIRTDKLVADHYADFDVDKARPVTVSKPRAVYVSYRKDGKVYWTRKKLMLEVGETLLTDGSTELRARCANRISDTPMLPVSADEPTQVELDSSSLDGSVQNTSVDGIEDAGFDGQPYQLKTFASIVAEPPADAAPGSADRFRFSRLGSAEGGPLTLSTSQLTVPASLEISPPPPTDTSRSTTPPDPAPPTVQKPELERPREDPSPFIPTPPLLQPERPGPPYNGAEEIRPVDVPEPATLWLGGLAGAAMLLLRRRTGRGPRRD